MWSYISSLDELRTGDIIETPSKIVSTSPILPGQQVRFVKHYGIICGNTVVHNPFGGKPCQQPIQDVLSDRVITRVIRTNASEKEIMDTLNKYKDEDYKFWTFNCEDFVRQVCKCDIGFDQRTGYSIATIGVIIAVLIVIAYVISKRR